MKFRRTSGARRDRGRSSPSARESRAPFPRNTAKRLPESFAARSKSRMPSASPISQCGFGVKAKAGGVPALRTTTLSCSPAPCGTESSSRFGTSERIASISVSSAGIVAPASAIRSSSAAIAGSQALRLGGAIGCLRDLRGQRVLLGFERLDAGSRGSAASRPARGLRRRRPHRRDGAPQCGERARDRAARALSLASVHFPAVVCKLRRGTRTARSESRASLMRDSTVVLPTVPFVAERLLAPEQALALYFSRSDAGRSARRTRWA